MTKVMTLIQAQLDNEEVIKITGNYINDKLNDLSQ